MFYSGNFKLRINLMACHDTLRFLINQSFQTEDESYGSSRYTSFSYKSVTESNMIVIC